MPGALFAVRGLILRIYATVISERAAETFIFRVILIFAVVVAECKVNICEFSLVSG
jgi:hypothetical protein